MISRTERQKICINKWLNSGHNTIQACTGFGKTRVALMLINSLLKVNSDISVLIIVPTEVLKNQWLNKLDEWQLLNNCTVEIVNSAIKKEWTCNLLVIDEIHLMASHTFSQIFETVEYQMILGLTATLERLDGKEILIKKFAPVCDTITLDEAKRMGWVSPIKEYAVLLDVDLTNYNKLNQKFNGYFAFFDWNFAIAMQACQNWKFRNAYAKQLGVTPKEVMGIAMGWMRCMNERKKFIRSHPKKIEICKKILAARKDKKCITFSATIKDAESLKIGEVLHSKKSKKKNAEILEKFNNIESGVLCTSKAADQGVDIKGLSVGIIMSIDSSKIRKTQRVGRIIRFEEGKTAELFTLILRDTQEWKWFQNSNISDTIVIDEYQLDDILNGKEVITRTRDQIEDIKYRF